MEIIDLASVLASIAAISGTGWLGIALSAVVLVCFLGVWVYFKKMLSEAAWRESKEQQLKDQVENRKENEKLESEWEKAQKKLAEQKTSPSNKKKRS